MTVGQYSNKPDTWHGKVWYGATLACKTWPWSVNGVRIGAPRFQNLVKVAVFALQGRRTGHM